MEAFFVSTGVVALSEMGDKTQLLSVLLSAKFRRPVPIIAGLFVATLVNHGFAGAVGGWVAHVLGPDLLRWVVGLSFLGMAAWTLIPDKFDRESLGSTPRFGVFWATVVTFFLAEMGDKTQIATVALVVHYHDLVSVVGGTTLGILLSDVPAVLLADSLAKKVSMRLTHAVAALIFGLLGVVALTGVERGL